MPAGDLAVRRRGADPESTDDNGRETRTESTFADERVCVPMEERG
jgi:hypothetical protein